MAPKGKMDAMDKKIADKTFGMKNKNKSKKIQGQIAQMKSMAGLKDPKQEKDTAAQRKAAADSALNQVLFTEALTKKEIARKAIEKAAEKVRKAKEAEAKDKRDIFTDTRDAKSAAPELDADDMSTWDEEKLRSVVDRKAGGQGKRCETDIICKHFIEAIEKRQFGWAWECPNGGDKCQYRHALPDGYVLKRDKPAFEEADQGPVLEAVLEEKLNGIKSSGDALTPVTLDRLTAWLNEKKAKKQAAEEAVLEDAKKQYAKGKMAGVTGRMLFEIDSSLFVDDAAAGGDTYVREDSDDEDAGAGGSSDAPGGSSADAGAADSAAMEPIDVSDMASALAGVDESLFEDEEFPDDI